uniref:Uncharacterized protein n=1 Tax=Arundo donax TaxID=35708 RepID=A0A0A9D430_ARUDO
MTQNGDANIAVMLMSQEYSTRETRKKIRLQEASNITEEKLCYSKLYISFRFSCHYNIISYNLSNISLTATRCFYVPEKRVMAIPNFFLQLLLLPCKKVLHLQLPTSRSLYFISQNFYHKRNKITLI